MKSPYFYLGREADNDAELSGLQWIYEITNRMPDLCEEIEDDGFITVIPNLKS